MTRTVTLLAPDCTVRFVLPFFRPFTTPFEVTEATVLFLIVEVTFSWLVTGVRTGVSFTVFPFDTVTEDGSPVSFVVRTIIFCTMTRIVFFSPLRSVMVTVAVPVFVPAVIFPVVRSTFTIEVFSEIQLRTSSPFARPLTFTADVTCPTRSRTLDTFVFIVGVRCVPGAETVIVLPHRMHVPVLVPFLNTVASLLYTYL